MSPPSAEGFQNMQKNFWTEFKKPILALAPMAGISDAAFRLLCRKHGADVVYTEMTSIDALYYDAKKTLGGHAEIRVHRTDHRGPARRGSQYCLLSRLYRR